MFLQKTIHVFLVSVFFFIGFNAFANDTVQPGFTIGVNVGVVMPDSKDAMFYNGSSEKYNSIDRILLSETYYKRLYEVLDDDVAEIHYPSKVIYKMAPILGVSMGYRLNRSSAIVADIRFCQLQTKSSFSLEMENVPINSLENVYYEYGTITSAEARFDVDLLYEHYFPSESPFTPFVGGGVNFNAIKVTDQEMEVQSFTAQMISASSAYNNNTQPGGVGYGLLGVAGVENIVREKYLCQLAYKLSRKKINLIPDDGHSLINEVFLRVYF